MARFSMADADNYTQSNAGSYFSLKDDKDTARVRFLYGTVDDIEGYAVYKVKVGDKERYVNSIRAYNEPIENDPFAVAGYKVQAKLFIPLLNIDNGEIQFWERGKTYFSRLASMASRYNPLYNEIIEVERNGKKGDTSTDYQFYPIENSPINLDELDIPSPLGTIILDKTYDEMQYYVDHGCFPDTSEQVAESRTAQRGEPMPTGRRTPENTGRRAF
jgi:hypothetical protein